jgi:peptide/nickel transport system substrate-binding protein
MRKLLILFAGAVLVVAACGPAPGSPSAPPASPSVQPSAPEESPSGSPQAEVPNLTETEYAPEEVGNRGGRLIMGISGEPVTIWWNIYDTFANNVDAFGPALWSLWGNTHDFAYYGQLAAEVPTVDNGGVVVNDDGGMTLTITLREGAQWSDGEAINCDDVSYMVDWVLDEAQEGLTIGTIGWEDITSVEGGDGTECTVEFSKVYEQYLALWSPLLPEHYLKTVPVGEAFEKLYTQGDPASGVYSGPYIPTNWSPNAQIDFVANDKFWETIKQAEPPFDETVLRQYSTPDAEIAGFVNGEIDVALELNHSHLASVEAAGVPPEQVDKTVGVTYEQHSWNMARLTDRFGEDGAKAVVEALHYATDKDAINERILGGTVTPSCSFTMDQTWFFADVPCYEYDPDKANQILDDAGFEEGSDGIRALDGEKLTFLGCARSDRQYRLDTLTLLGDQLAEIGASVEVKATPPEVLFAGWQASSPDQECNLTRGNYDVAEFAWLATPDPTSISQLYHSRFDPSEGDHQGQNYIRVKIPELDELLDGILTTVDLLDIKADMETIQELYVDPANAFPEIALYNWTTVELIAPTMHNVVNNSTAATQTWNIEDWWRDPQ